MMPDSDSVLTAISEDPYSHNQHHEEHLDSDSSLFTDSTQKTSECEGIVDTILDTSQAQVSTLSVVETFLLSVIILSAFSVAELVGNLMATSVNAYFSPIISVAMSVLAVPMITNHLLVENGSFLTLLLSGSCQGLLVGAALSRFAIFSEPLLVPALLSTSLVLFLIGDMSRPTILAVTAGTSLIFHFSLGSPSRIHYLLSILYTLCMMVPIQMNAKTRNAMKVSDQHAVVLVAIILGVKCLVYGILGVNI